jgi:hypothetical protein
MYGDRSLARRRNLVADVVDAYSEEGIVLNTVSGVRRAHDPITVLDGVRFYEMSKYISITGVAAIPGAVPRTGPNTPPLRGPNPFLCHLGIEIGYQIESKWDKSNQCFRLVQFITSDTDNDAYVLIQPGYTHGTTIKRCALFTDKGKMLRYTAYRVVKDMLDVNQNCQLSMDNMDWIVSCGPCQGFLLTAKL